MHLPFSTLLLLAPAAMAQEEPVEAEAAAEAPPAPLPEETRALLDGLADQLLEASALPPEEDIRWKEPRVDLRQTNANLEEVYRQHRLVLLEREDAPWGFGGATWKIRTGDGRVIGVRGFAERVGDEEMLQRLEKERRAARWLPVGLAAGGVGLVGGSVGLVITADAAAERQVEPNWPDPEQYASEEAYQLALAQAEADYQYAADIFVENRRWTAGVLSVSGLALLASAPLVAPGIGWRHHYPALYYDRDEAQLLVDRYNRALRKELGLDEGALEEDLDTSDFPEDLGVEPLEPPDGEAPAEDAPAADGAME